MATPEEPFAPPSEAADTPATPPVEDAVTTFEGGHLPQIGDLFSETMTEFVDNIGPYALAGLGLMLLLLPVIFIMIFVMYAGMFGIMIGMMGGVFGALAVFGENEAGGIVAVLIQLVSMVVLFAFMFGCIGMMNVLLAPVNASLMRAARDHQRGIRKLEFASAFSTLTQDLGKVIGVAIIMMTLTTLAVMACYLPALIVGFFLMLAAPLVALHRLGPMAGIRGSFDHVRANLGWHALFFVVYLFIIMVSGNIPVVGPMFALAFITRTYRHLFGDGEEPVFTVGGNVTAW